MSGAGKTVGLDALPLLANYGKGAGISKYLVNWFGAMRRAGGFDYKLFVRGMKNYFVSGGRLRTEFGCPARGLFLPDRVQAAAWRAPLLPGLLERALYGGLDLYVSTTYFTPSLARTKVASFFYDIIPLRSAGVAEDYKRSFLELAATTISRSSVLLTISEHARADILSYFSLPAEKVKVIYPCISGLFRPRVLDGESAAVLRKFGLESGGYVLSTGTISRNKNQAALLRAYLKLIKGRGFRYKLVLAGKTDSDPAGFAEVRDLVVRHGLGGRVLIAGYLDDAQAAVLCSFARVFAFMSLYEGFGMPVAEAMACGTPVVSSNAASLPEVCAGAALEADPRDTDAIAEALYRAAEDEGLRPRLSRAGLERASFFGPETAAARTLQVFERVTA